MSTIQKIWEKIRRSESVLFSTFQIDPSRCLGDNPSIGEPIKARKDYFEVSLTEQFLKYKREYWNEYIPLTLFLTNFIYANERRSFPFVVGPELLKNLKQLEGNESIRYKNTRVVGPTPYIGDNITLFAGLFRVRTKNWAEQSINLLETVAKSFDKTKLSNYVNIAEPLLDGIEGFLGMGDDMQFRIGQRDEYKDAGIHSTNVFKSGYYVMIRERQEKVEEKNFWVKDSQLFYGSKKNNLKLYDSKDYVLYEINASQNRQDYETFEFHEHWESARIAIIRKQIQEAENEFEHLKVKLFSSRDIIEMQKNQLFLMYLGMYEDIKATFLKKSTLTDIATSIKNNKDMLSNKGIEIQIPQTAVNITTDLIKAKATTFAKSNYVIDQNFIVESLNHPILNRPEIAESFVNFSPSIDLLEKNK